MSNNSNNRLLAHIHGKALFVLGAGLVIFGATMFPKTPKQQAKQKIDLLAHKNDSIRKSADDQIFNLYDELDVVTATANLSNPEQGKRISDSLKSKIDSIASDATRQIAINKATMDSLRNRHNIKAH